MSYDREEREERVRKPQKPIRYTYRYQKSSKTPEVHGVTAPKLGEIISTKAGPAKVLEVFWRSATDVDVLLRLVESETIREKLAAQDAIKSPKTQKAKPRAPKASRAPRAK